MYWRSLKHDMDSITWKHRQYFRRWNPGVFRRHCCPAAKGHCLKKSCQEFWLESWNKLGPNIEINILQLALHYQSMHYAIQFHQIDEHKIRILCTFLNYLFSSDVLKFQGKLKVPFFECIDLLPHLSICSCKKAVKSCQFGTYVWSWVTSKFREIKRGQKLGNCPSWICRWSIIELTK